MARICLLVNAFYPDLTGETFLANELEYLKGFDRFVVIPVFAHENSKPFDYGPCENQAVTVLRPDAFTGRAKLVSVLRSLCFPALYREMMMLLREGRLTPGRAAAALRYAAHGIFLGRDIRSRLQDIGADDDVVIYAYWMNHSAFAAAYLHDHMKARSIRTLTRGHRIDIYEYANTQQYIPMRRYTFDRMDLLCPIAEDGRRYLMEHDGLSSERIRVMRLGTADHGTHIPARAKTLRLVSCSWMRPVKRIHLIVEALAKLDIPVEWTHFGDGEEFGRIRQMVDVLDKPNIRCHLRGRAVNQDILAAYGTEDFDAFINVSESEGVPVSIMEAMSFGKIIIATDAGGSGEIVRDGVNGRLLPVACTADDVADAIRSIHLQSDAEHHAMCLASRRIWEDMCDARVNYREFSDMLAEL